ncbi:small integral membrane protein 22 [Phascolarctos cinereus]|uniref:Small integral membrane protein 22 n=1 Tax=Phascolarctos cinereus TaxID=38626 RepID=A0A6P5JSF1_PHACI|nr:small integral membrane protein 22 [Phascolarctos cinereus]
MAPSSKEVLSELQETAQELLSRLKSHHLFQSEWDIAAFVVFLTFTGTVLVLTLLVLLYCCCCNSSSPPKRRPKGVDNLALEP